MSAQSTGISSSATPIPVGIASYSNEYDAAYCIVQIADVLNGSYELAEVVMIDDFDGSDPENIMLTEFGNVKVGTAFAGLGTISARRTGSDSDITELTFVPNAGIGVSITTFLNALRPEENNTLLPAEATREVGGESVKDLQNASLESGFAIYEGTDIAIKRQFALENNGNPIFKKPYDGSSSQIVDLTNNTITLPNHFFTSGQKVNYSPGAGTSIGIDTAPFSMPESVFIIKKGEDKVQLALTAQNALKEIALPVGLSTVGIGTSHTFTAIDPNQKVLVAIDNAIQSPVAGTSVTTTLDKSTTIGDDVIHFTGITSFFGADYVRVGSGVTAEIMKIVSVGIGTTNAIKVRRGWLGTTIRARESGALVEKIRGNYNIIENEINFTEAPPGKNPIGSTTNPPDERDFVGITTSSSFQGRVFTRSGVRNGTEETYADNYLFDDISQGFNGQTKVFDLTHSNGTSITGVSTNNALVLINGILQAPGSNGDFTLSQPSGTQLTWTGSASSVARDPNNASIPVGGLIVSVGSTRGFGYQPLVSAGGTVVVSSAGTISSVSIGNTGSGYRAGIQTVVNVAIQTERFGGSGVVSIGTAAISDGHITSVAITTDRVFYIPRDITNVGYTSITGLTTVTTSSAHGLIVGNEIVLSGIALTCDYAPAVGVQSAIYHSASGIMTVTTSSAHGLSITGKSSDVLLNDLGMSSSSNGSTPTHTFPRSGDDSFCGVSVAGVASVTQFSINIGSGVTLSNYISGGTVQPVLISPRANNNSASKQDPAFDGSTVLRILNSTQFEVNTGISTRAHNYARCGKVNQLMKVVIDKPLSYSDIPLVYSGNSPGVGGTEARADVVVSQGSTVVNFKISNLGYGYGVNHILTLPRSNDTNFSAVGIPTTSSFTPAQELEITVNEVDSDQFTGWAVGQIQVLDNFSNLFDGSRRTFPITVSGEALSIQSRPGSLVKVEDTLFVFVNDILQIPGESYSFPGGATITFDEPPKAEDSLKILFYRGTGGADVVDRDVIATVKVGDTLTLGYHEDLDQKDWLQENERSVVEITSSNSVDTNPYDGPGVFEDTREKRPITWTRQTEDLFIEGKLVDKSRELYDGRIFPSTHMIQSVGVGTTVVYVSNLRPYFNPKNENLVSTDFQKDIVIFNNAERVAAAATAVVSSAGTITSVVISDGGKGYVSAPSVTIQNPVGLGTTSRAEATATLSGGSVSAITVGVQSGIGYTSANPPVVLIAAEPTVIESNTVVSFAGDSGVISGVGTTTIDSVSNPCIILDLVIPYDSDLRNSNITQGTTSGIVTSGLQVNDFFVIKNSNVGTAMSSLDYNDGSVVGIGSTRLDNVYRVAAVNYDHVTDAVGFGQTTVTQVTVSVANTSGLVGLANSEYYGDYSYGKLILSERNVSRAYTVNTSAGIAGIETGVIINRKTSLKVGSYTT